jgi:ABC-type multidrug transport system fused ATPase/permease subunit
MSDCLPTQLLTRLHDPTSGEMLIDGRPAGDDQLRGLRTATALLSQDHTLFPVPVRENIALGRPDDTVSQAAVEDAARLGGAHAFIGKLGKAYATDLQLSDRLSNIFFTILVFPFGACPMVGYTTHRHL